MNSHLQEMAAWARKLDPRRRVFAMLVAIAVGYSALYSYSFVFTVYTQPHTRNLASEWIFDHVPPGSTILHEHWDDWLPVPLPGKGTPAQYLSADLPLYDDDFPRHEKSWDTASPNRAKYDVVADSLSRGDYIAVASRKLYGSVMRVENKRYKLASQFYKLLFSGRLGYEHVKTFQNPPRVLGMTVEEDAGEEAFTIYDHPKICIFKKVRPYTRERYLEMLTTPAPPDVAALTLEDVLHAEAGRPIWQREVRSAPLRWWLVLTLVTLVTIPYVFRVCGGLPDRGLLLAKPIGALLLTYCAWLISSARLAPYGPGLVWIVLLLLAGGAAILHYRHRAAFAEHLRTAWTTWLAGELLFLIVFGVFLAIRMMNPDIRWSEKPMDFSFLNAAYRTDYFPARDPWVSGFFINYYYWGHVLYATLGLASGVPPSYAYNLGTATAPALAFTAAFALVYALTRRLRYGALSGFLAVFAGNLVGYLQIARNLVAAGYRHDLTLSVWEYVRMLPEVLLAAWRALWALGDGNLPQSVPHPALGFDQYFWLTGHFTDRPVVDLVPGAVANEFPMWSYLHADLHSHLIIMAFSMTFFGLVASLFLGGGNGRRLFGPGTSWPMAVLILALLLGAVSCINTWDLPTTTLVLTLALVAKLIWHRKVAVAERRAAVDALRRLGVTSERCLRIHLALRAVATDVVLPLAAVIGLAFVFLYWPFHTYFEPRVTSVRLTDIAFTPVLSFCKIFAVFLVVVLPFFVLAFAGWGRERTRNSRIALGLAAGLVLLAAVLHPFWSEGRVGDVVRALWWKLPFEREMPNAAAFRPKWGLLALLLPLSLANLVLLFRRAWSAPVRFALLLSFMGLSIGWGCELVYVFEVWSGPLQRWNTPFKFYLQIWLLLALAAPVFLRSAFAATIATGGASRWALLARGALRSWAVVVGFFVAAAAVFPVFGTYAVLWGIGARSAAGQRPSLDGLQYMEAFDILSGEYEAITWFNRNVPGNKAVVMEAAPGYYNELGRWGTYTGMPSVLGWDHHIGERGHVPEKAPRTIDVHRFYQSTDKAECFAILKKYGVDYVIVGEIERSRWLHAGQPLATQTAKFREWGDVLELVFDNSAPGRPGVQIYRVRQSWAAPPAQPVGAQQPSS